MYETTKTRPDGVEKHYICVWQQAILSAAFLYSSGGLYEDTYMYLLRSMDNVNTTVSDLEIYVNLFLTGSVRSDKARPL